MRFIETVFKKVRKHPKGAVFSDGELPRVIKGAELYYQRQLGIPILLGRREVITEIAQRESISLDHVAVINPENSSELPVFCRRLERIERYPKVEVKDNRALMVRPNYFAAMMV